MTKMQSERNRQRERDREVPKHGDKTRLNGKS